MDFRNYIPAENPRKIIGMVVSFAVILLVLWLFMVSRMNYQSTSPSTASDPASQERRDSVREMMGKIDTEHPVEQRSSRIFLNAFTTFVVLIVILAGVWILFRKKSYFGQSNKSFRELGQHVIGPNQQIKVLEINSEIWVLGIGTNSITLLHRYPKDQWKEPVKNPSGQRFYDTFSGKL
ncbi:MAG: flagellar biosynthetic protein FliO [Balneolales bacterium]